MMNNVHKNILTRWSIINHQKLGSFLSETPMFRNLLAGILALRSALWLKTSEIQNFKKAWKSDFDFVPKGWTRANLGSFERPRLESEL